jgi:hypothetical protein
MKEQPEPRPPSAPAAQSAAAPSPPAEPSVANPRIEDYLDHICAPLVDIVSYETRQELRAHLESLSASYEELGASRDRAVRAALRQAGDAGLVACQYAALARGTAPPRRSLPAWAGVLAVFVGLALLEPLSLILSAWLPGGNHNLIVVGGISGIVGENHAMLWDIIVRNALLTGLLGLGVGLATPRRVNWLTLGVAALIPLALLAGSLQQFLAAIAAHGAILGPNGLVTYLLDQSRFLLPLAPIGCAGAALGEWLRNRLPRRQSRWALR